VTNDQKSQVDKIVDSTLTAPEEKSTNIQRANIKLSVIFEAMKLIIEVNRESKHVAKAMAILVHFLTAKETNFRYVGLDIMSHFIGYPETKSEVLLQMDSIIESLKDKDLSVQQRALDLLFYMCDSQIAGRIVKELIDFLPLANYEIQDELVLKIAILAEKYGKSRAWFIDIILELISTAGEHVGDELWFRVVQIVTNHEEVRPYAASRVLKDLKSELCNEKTVKIAGYILGEYGHLIANEPGSSPLEQFMILHAKFRTASSSTRCILLSNYLKLVNLFPEIKQEIVRVFRHYSRVLDLELQQRACEYLTILEMETDELLQAICEEMPAFSEKHNILITQLEMKYTEKSNSKALKLLESQMANISIVTDISGIIISNDNLSPFKEENQSNDLLDLQSEVIPVSLVKPVDELRYKLYTENTGILYEDNILQIGLKMEFRNNLGKVALFFGNKLSIGLNNVSSLIEPSSALSVTIDQSIADTIPAGTQYHQMFDLECVSVITELPVLKVTFQITSQIPREITLQLPIIVSKFIVPVQLTSAVFTERWKQLELVNREFKRQIFVDSSSYSKDIKNTLASSNIKVLDESSDHSLKGSGIFFSKKEGKVGCLILIEKSLQVRLIINYRR
jgi:AP-2 complex subunit alpha